MRLTAVFFLFVLFSSLGSAWAIQMSKNMRASCCAKMKITEACGKPSSHEKKGCDSNYCNPFLTCSSVPAVLPKSISVKPRVKSVKHDYVLYDVKTISTFLSKHWQPPRD